MKRPLYIIPFILSLAIMVVFLGCSQDDLQENANNQHEEEGSVVVDNGEGPVVSLIEQRFPQPFSLKPGDEKVIGGSSWLEVQFDNFVQESFFWDNLEVEGAEVKEKRFNKENTFRFLLIPYEEKINIALPGGSGEKEEGEDSPYPQLKFTLYYEEPTEVDIYHETASHLDTSNPQFMAQLIAVRGPLYRGTLGQGDQMFVLDFSKPMATHTVEDTLKDNFPPGLAIEFAWEDSDLLKLTIKDPQIGQEYSINVNGSEDERGMVLARQPVLSLLTVNSTIIYGSDGEDAREVARHDGFAFNRGEVSPGGDMFLLQEYLDGEGDLAPTLCWIYNAHEDNLFPAAPPRLLAGTPALWFPDERALLLPHLQGITVSYLIEDDFTYRELVEMEEEEYLLGADLSRDGGKVAYVYGGHDESLNLELILLDERKNYEETLVSFEGIIRRAATDGVSLPVEISWSPDGAQLAVSEFTGDDWQVSIVELETESKTVLQSSARSPSWSPSGDYIFLEGSWEQPASIVNIQGDVLAELPQGVFMEPHWNKEGDMLLVTDYTDVRNPAVYLIAVEEEGEVKRQRVGEGDALGWHPQGEEFFYLMAPFIDFF